MRSLLTRSFAVPVVLALCFVLISNYVPFPLPPPYEDYSIVKEPYWEKAGSFTGKLAVNKALENADTLFDDKIDSPETIKFDQNGTMFLFTKKGIFTAAPQGDTFEDPVLYHQIEGGLAFSGDFDSQGNLYFCDSVHGLGKIDRKNKNYEILISNEEIACCNDLVISSWDEVYIADATIFKQRDAGDGYVMGQAAILHGGQNGRVLRYTPLTKKLEVIMENLTLANGIEIASDESHIIVSDALMLRYQRYWLTGPHAHKAETYLGNLTGYTDGVSKGSNHTYWMAILSAMTPSLQFLMSYRLLRRLAFFIPEKALLDAMQPYGLIIQADMQGNILRSFHDTSGKFGQTTSVIERNGKLYIGSLNRRVKVVDLDNITY